MKIESVIVNKLQQCFDPLHLEVINESHQHNVAPGSESHFKVIVVSEQFDGQRLIQRHRAVNKCLAEQLANDIHALAIHTFSLSEWQQQVEVRNSPNCLGGSKKDPLMNG